MRGSCRVGVAALSLLVATLASAGGEGAGAEAPQSAGAASSKPIHVSLGSGVFRPWDGDLGYSLSGSAHVGLGSDRFWVGGELEFRKFGAELKRDYDPDMNTFALRFSFQYHPFPRWLLSPYLGISVGVVLNRVEDNKSRFPPYDKMRDDVSVGTTLLGLAGFEVPLGTDRLHLFAEARLGTTSDLWKKRGANHQLDQVGGVTGIGGLRVRL